MKCPRCQHENEAAAKFCEECATPLARACTKCGRPLSPTAKFCPECAHPAAVSAVPSPAQRFASPDSYTPKHLAERILTSKTALEGERKQVTVLFADLKGSMELLADRDPEDARKILDPVLEHMMEAVHQYEGTVNQVMGDGIMALFGAPLAHEDHAVRACYAALRMQESVNRYAEEIRRAEGVPVRIRVGLNSGEVVVRSIGSDLHMDYTAVGQTTHLAARMEQMATPRTILLAPATRKLVEGYVRAEPHGPVTVKGLPNPIEVYTLTEASAFPSRLHAAAARGLTRFIGRDAEIEQIGQRLTVAREGHGQVVAIAGEPGVGKSRVVHEAIQCADLREWLVVEAGAVSHGKATSYLPVIQLLKAYFRIHGREAHQDILQRVTAAILDLDRSLSAILTALLALLDLPVDDAEWQLLEPAERRLRTLDAVKRLLLAESRRQPLLIVFEDLQWIDAETQALLDSLIESLPTVPVLLLVNFRLEYQHGWSSRPYYSQLRLEALRPDDAGEFLSALLGDDPALDPLKRLLVKRGNPFFIEENIRTLVEARALVGERGSYRLARPIESIEIPATVQVILAARIDRLSPDDKQLLQAASVIGKDVPLLLLRAVADLSEEAVDVGLARLQASEFLYEIRLFPDLEYTFKHALTYEVVYGSLLRDRRKVLHAGIIGAIERLYAERLAEHVERLAHHAIRAEMWDKAVTYLHQAGIKALSRSANREAVGSFEQALAALSHLPESRQTHEQGIDLRFDLRTALFPLGRFEQIFGYLREAESLARTLDDRLRLGQSSVYLCQHLWVIGHPKEAIAFGRNANELATSLGDIRLQVTASLYLAAALIWTGGFREAKELLLKVVRFLQGDLSRERFGLAGFPIVLVHFYLALLFANQGEFEEGIAHSKEGIRVAQSLDHPYSLANVIWTLECLQISRGELGQALQLIERGLTLSREWNLTFHSAAQMGRLGYLHALSGEVAEGIPLLEHAASAGDKMGFGAFQPLFLMDLAEGYSLGGRSEDALVVAVRARNLARENGQRPYEACALRLIGDIDNGRDSAQDADRSYQEALDLAVDLGMHPLIAHCHAGLAKLYRRTGRREEADEHLATATALYGELGMSYWLGKLEREMAELR